MIETIQSSPPSTPLSTTGDEVDQLDELHFPSSPSTTPPPIHESYDEIGGGLHHILRVLLILVYFWKIKS